MEARKPPPRSDAVRSGSYTLPPTELPLSPYSAPVRSLLNTFSGADTDAQNSLFRVIASGLQHRPGALSAARDSAQGPSRNLMRLMLDIASAAAEGETSGLRRRWEAPWGLTAPAQFQEPFEDPFLELEAASLNPVPASVGGIGSLLATSAAAPLRAAWQLGRLARLGVGFGAATLGSSGARAVAGENAWPGPLKWVPRLLLSFNPRSADDDKAGP